MNVCLSVQGSDSLGEEEAFVEPCSVGPDAAKSQCMRGVGEVHCDGRGSAYTACEEEVRDGGEGVNVYVYWFFDVLLCSPHTTHRRVLRP